MKKISIILAVHNESANIPLVMQSIEKSKQDFQNKYEIEVIAVNDGSTDNSLYMLNTAQKDYLYLKIINHSHKLGMTAVVSSALTEASGAIIMFFPADMESHPDEDIPKLLGILEKGYDVAAGRRINRKDGKCFFSRLGNFLISKRFGLKIHDINWIKAMTRQAAETMVLKHAWVRFMLLFPHFHGMKIAEVNTNWYHRTYGNSKFGALRIIEALKDLLLLEYYYLKGDFLKKD